MGQEQIKQDLQLKNTPSKRESVVTSGRKPIVPVVKASKRIECEGLLKLRSTPFKNSIEIET